MKKQSPTEIPLPPPDPARQKGCPLERDFGEFVLETLRKIKRPKFFPVH